MLTEREEIVRVVEETLGSLRPLLEEQLQV